MMAKSKIDIEEEISNLCDYLRAIKGLELHHNVQGVTTKEKSETPSSSSSKIQDNNYLCIKNIGQSYIFQILNFKTVNSECSYSKFLKIHSDAYKNLKNLKVNNLDDFLMFLMCYNNLNMEDKQSFDEQCLNKVSMTLTLELFRFIYEKAKEDILKSENATNGKSDKSTNTCGEMSNPIGRASSMQITRVRCIYCKSCHELQDCQSFLKLTPRKRKQILKGKHLCFNCFSRGHGFCNCKSETRCEVCKERHHILLCFETN